VLALLLLGMSILVFVLHIEVAVARAQSSVKLLWEMGYSPRMLHAFLIRQFSVPLLMVVGGAIVLGLATQYAASLLGRSAGLHLDLIPGWPFWLCIAAMCGLLAALVRTGVAGALRKA
jgi:hypothetical protein